MRLSWLIALLLTTYFFQQWIDYKRNPNQYINLQYNQPVVLKQNSRGHYIANGRINNQPVLFLLDTGATDVVIPEALAAGLSLSRLGKTQVSTANGVITVYPTLLNSISLGGISAANIEAVINPYMDHSTILLGMSFLKHLSLVQHNGVLTINPTNNK
ncbi:MAG: TIGR02281 family clan AA aspartic protease [Oceanospirillaceae bacterium]|nr:TIGR02281 family clan AA aspartic protease [Oceanospirillaceae bacterium]